MKTGKPQFYAHYLAGHTAVNLDAEKLNADELFNSYDPGDENDLYCFAALSFGASDARNGHGPRSREQVRIWVETMFNDQAGKP